MGKHPGGIYPRGDLEWLSGDLCTVRALPQEPFGFSAVNFQSPLSQLDCRCDCPLQRVDFHSFLRWNTIYTALSWGETYRTPTSGFPHSRVNGLAHCSVPSKFRCWGLCT